MSVTLKITPVLRQFTDNQETVQVEGTTVRECLNSLVARYPGTEKWLFSKSSAPMICIFLNREVVMPEDLDTNVSAGDVIDLCPVIGGG
jgi:molybdopterin synthase sulfur carrier subunit